MHTSTLWAAPDRYLAAHHDGEAAGRDARRNTGGSPGTDAGGGTPPVRTVGPDGRSTEAVRAALAAVPGDLARLIHDKPDDQLMQPAQDGGWGLVEILPHLRDWEVILGERVERILEEEAPTFEEYDDSLWAIENAYRDQNPREALREFTDLRNALVARLDTLDEAGWNRVAILAKQGRVTLHWLLDQFCTHDAKHVVQARDVLA